MAKDFSAAMIKWGNRGFKTISEDEYCHRRKICSECHGGWRCPYCGCALRFKIALIDEKCPIDKWWSKKSLPENHISSLKTAISKFFQYFFKKNPDRLTNLMVMSAPANTRSATRHLKHWPMQKNNCRRQQKRQPPTGRAIGHDLFTWSKQKVTRAANAVFPAETLQFFHRSKRSKKNFTIAGSANGSMPARWLSMMKPQQLPGSQKNRSIEQIETPGNARCRPVVPVLMRSENWKFNI